LGAWLCELVDCAGERELDPASGPQAIERAGQELAQRWQARADLVLYLADAADWPASANSAPRERCVVFASRADRVAATARARLDRPLSAAADPEAASAWAVRALHEGLRLPLEPWQAGRAVPFLTELVEDLRAARQGGQRARVERWLAH
jgi:tRNA U34 5-carboxymethylaminomethyl modifying GTPase MnmE/TrmE